MDALTLKYETCRTCLKPLQLHEYNRKTREKFNVYRNWRIRNVLVGIPTFRLTHEQEDLSPIHVCEKCYQQCENFIQFTQTAAQSVQKANSDKMFTCIKSEVMDETNRADITDPNYFLMKNETEGDQLVNNYVQHPIEEFSSQAGEYTDNSVGYNEALLQYGLNESAYTLNGFQPLQPGLYIGEEVLPEQNPGTIVSDGHYNQQVIDPLTIPTIATEANETDFAPSNYVMGHSVERDMYRIESQEQSYSDKYPNQQVQPAEPQFTIADAEALYKRLKPRSSPNSKRNAKNPKTN